jgi:hypothetical protein
MDGAFYGFADDLGPKVIVWVRREEEPSEVYCTRSKAEGNKLTGA